MFIEAFLIVLLTRSISPRTLQQTLAAPQSFQKLHNKSSFTLLF